MTYRDVAEAATRWALAQVRYDDLGPWIPEQSTPESLLAPPAQYRDGMHSGIGGLGHLLAEVRRNRPWSAEEAELADAVARRLRARWPDTTDVSWFDGLVGDLGVLFALETDGVDDCVGHLDGVVRERGWPEVNDATMGKAAVLVGAVQALAHGVASARPLAERAADVVLAEAEETPHGLNWLFKPRRLVDEVVQMPNWSHGLAGVAAAVADAGVTLGRDDLVDAARRGAEHLVTLGDTSGGGFVVPRRLPPKEGEEVVTWNWCHGPAGTALLFLALERAGVAEIAGEPPARWIHRCVRSLATSGIPERRHPGFWDNDGRCCGTAGVGDVLLDLGEPDLARTMADALLARANHDGDHAYWRFVEYRAAEPLLPPGVGWMQGAAGIAAFLFRCGRVRTLSP